MPALDLVVHSTFSGSIVGFKRITPPPPTKTVHARNPVLHSFTLDSAYKRTAATTMLVWWNAEDSKEGPYTQPRTGVIAAGHDSPSIDLRGGELALGFLYERPTAWPGWCLSPWKTRMSARDRMADTARKQVGWDPRLWERTITPPTQVDGLTLLGRKLDHTSGIPGGFYHSVPRVERGKKLLVRSLDLS